MRKLLVLELNEDNRGESLWVTLSYPHEIARGLRATFNSVEIADLSAEVVFIAIKNGHHSGIGYFVDTAVQATPAAEPIPLTELWQRAVSAFA